VVAAAAAAVAAVDSVVVVVAVPGEATVAPAGSAEAPRISRADMARATVEAPAVMPVAAAAERAWVARFSITPAI
jgi:hypothetical protein